MAERDDSLEAIFHRIVKRSLTPARQGHAMEAFRRAVKAYRNDGDGRLLAQDEPQQATPTTQ